MIPFVPALLASAVHLSLLLLQMIDAASSDHGGLPAAPCGCQGHCCQDHHDSGQRSLDQLVGDHAGLHLRPRPAPPPSATEAAPATKAAAATTSHLPIPTCEAGKRVTLCSHLQNPSCHDHQTLQTLLCAGFQA